MMNIQIWSFLAMSEKNGMEKLHEKLLKMFFVELMFEHFTGGNVLWGFHCPPVFGRRLNNYI